METGNCNYGGQCIEAHGVDEQNEWKQRFEYRRMRLERARENELYGKSYTETLLEKWVNAAAPDHVMRESIDGVDDSCQSSLSIVISSKESKENWQFTLQTKKELKAVALVQDAYRSHFTIKEIHTGTDGDVEVSNDQEWVRNGETQPKTGDSVQTHTVNVSFSTNIYGTFRQSVVFDFGTEPVLVKHICVDVVPVSDMDKMTEIKKDLVVYTAKRWDDSNAVIVPFVSGFVVAQTAEQLSDAEYEKQLMERYPCPSAMNLQLSQSTITEKRLTRNNYRNRMHELLFVEEIARYETVARFNLTTKLKITANYLLTPCGLASTSAKYSNDGELFALLQLRKDISEDTSAGRLILNNCTAVNLALAEEEHNEDGKRTVYESVIEDKGKNSIYLKLSPRTVRELNLKQDTEVKVDIQFKLNRLSFCEWHRAVDKVADYRLIFPDTLAPPAIPWTPKKQWMDVLDGAKLNAKQKEAVLAITSPQTVPLPPILLIGPFGTGKTFTLALAIKQLLAQPEPRILICTHSNSAADLYIKEYLHPWVKDEGLEAARPLRVYYHKRWVTTAHPTVQEYCLIDVTPHLRSFRRPTVEDVTKHRIVVVTLSISMELSSLDLPKGYFTHIFLDEAAQALECEAIMALGLASETTKIVLAGDHMQMSPELFSEFAKERNMHMSLLERLYDHYPTDFPCKILLCENYRAHDAIIKYTSELFYDQKLIASGKQPRHDKFYPLTFFTTRGEDFQDRNSTTFYNNAEVYELVERVAELVAQWPTKAWGPMTDSSIGIMTPYADQVMRIRLELRKKKLGKISVERVLNVQGKQFRAVFLSTVRTRKTCPSLDSGGNGSGGSVKPSNGAQREVDYGFLSNSKLLNTAITRAQSLVAVVGDPVSLCSVGRCRKVWERFIETCNENNSLFGITWSMLRSQLDGVELKKTFVLNPMAPEFVPRAEVLRRMMASSGGAAQYYSGPDIAQPINSTTMTGTKSGNTKQQQQQRPYMNIDDMLEMYHPGGPSKARQQQQQQQHGNHQHQFNNQQNHAQPHPPPPPPPSHHQNPHFGGAGVSNNMPGMRPPLMNQPGGMSSSPMGGGFPNQYYPPQQQQQQMPHPNVPPQVPNMGFDRPPGPGHGHLIPPQHGQTMGNMNQHHQPPMSGPGPLVPGAVKWGTVPPNINPQLTGTNAWQMAKPQQQQQQPGMGSGFTPPKMNPLGGPPSQQQPPLPVQMPQQMRSPSNGASQWMTGGGLMNPHSHPNQQQLEFMGPNHHMSAMNAATPPGFPVGMRGSNSNNSNSANVRPLSGGGGMPLFPPHVPQNPIAQMPPLPPNNMNDEMLHRMQLQQQLQMRSNNGPPMDQSDLSSMAALQERFMMMNAGMRPNVPNKAPQLPPMANGVLLPPNKNIYEMAVESKDVQLKWFTRLVETHGWDAAYKFAEMMGQAQSIMAQEFAAQRQAMVKGPQQQQQQQQMPHLQQVYQQQQFQQQQQLQQQQQSPAQLLNNNRMGIPSPNVRSINNEVDMAFDKLMNGSGAGTGSRQPIMRLFDEPAPISLRRADSLDTTNRRPVDGGMFGPPMSEQPRVEVANASSVPLYRRQAGQSTTSSSSVSSMSSQSAGNGWALGESSGQAGNNMLADSLFNRMAGDFGGLFGVGGGDHQQQQQILLGDGGGSSGSSSNSNRRRSGELLALGGSKNENVGGALTYASVLSQSTNNEGIRDQGRVGDYQNVTGNRGWDVPGRGMNEGNKDPSFQSGNRNGFYNYFG